MLEVDNTDNMYSYSLYYGYSH